MEKGTENYDIELILYCNINIFVSIQYIMYNNIMFSKTYKFTEKMTVS